MKYIITILIILPVFCFGQEDGRGNFDSIPIRTPLFYGHRFVKDTTVKILDTIPVLMLVTDSSLNNWYVNENTYGIRLVPHMAYSLNGYSVRKIANANDDSNGEYWCASCKDYWRHSYYLGEDKKELSKNIIVWQSIENK